MTPETVRRLVGEKVSDHVQYECALRDLVSFVDGLTYRQLEDVPGLFEATRKARLVLPGDHISDSVVAPRMSPEAAALTAILHMLENTDGMSDSDIKETAIATARAALTKST